MAILHPGGNVIAAREPTGVSELDATLTAIVERAARLAGAEVVIARLADETGGHVAHAVHARSESVRAELEASRIDAASVPAAEETGLEELPQALRLAAERVGAVDVVRLPVRDNGSVVGSVELMRTRTEFDEVQVALARRAYAGEHGRATHDPLELAGDALAVGSAETHSADQVAHLAAEATDARACLVWQYADDEEPVLAALAGPDSAAAPAYALEVLRRAVESREPVTVEPVGEPGWLVTLRLGEPPVGVLQLLIGQEPDPEGPLLPRLATFAVRAAHALRTSEHRRTLAADLDRTRALLTIVGQAIAELSLTHTLDTAVDRVRDLLSVERLAVYLVPAGGGGLATASGRSTRSRARSRRASRWKRRSTSWCGRSSRSSTSMLPCSGFRTSAATRSCRPPRMSAKSGSPRRCGGSCRCRSRSPRCGRASTAAAMSSCSIPRRRGRSGPRTNRSYRSSTGARRRRSSHSLLTTGSSAR